jgi:hypothetical protein
MRRSRARFRCLLRSAAGGALARPLGVLPPPFPEPKTFTPGPPPQTGYGAPPKPKVKRRVE